MLVLITFAPTKKPKDIFLEIYFIKICCMQIFTNKFLTYLQENSVLFENPSRRIINWRCSKTEILWHKWNGKSYFNNHRNLQFVNINQVFQENSKRKTPSAIYLAYVLWTLLSLRKNPKSEINLRRAGLVDIFVP